MLHFRHSFADRGKLQRPTDFFPKSIEVIFKFISFILSMHHFYTLLNIRFIGYQF